MTTNRDPIWDALAEHSKDKFEKDRQAFLTQANASDDGKWTKHTDYHWSRMIEGKRMDYWPSRKKFQFDGVVYRGLKKMHGILENPNDHKQDNH